MSAIQVLRDSLVNRLERLENNKQGQLSSAAQVRIKMEAEDIEKCYEALQSIEQQITVQGDIIDEQSHELMRTKFFLNEYIRDSVEASDREFKLVLWIKKKQLNG